MTKIIVSVNKVVGGGAGLATYDNLDSIPEEKRGKKVFVWGALPGEKVEIEIYKERSKFDEAFVTEVIEPSEYRIKNIDDHFLATSPWQCYDFDFENILKTELVREALTFHEVSIDINLLNTNQKAAYSGDEINYRNKYIYEFCPNEKAFAVFQRATDKLIKIECDALPKNEISQKALTILKQLQHIIEIKSESLVKLLLRSNREGEVVSRLYLKDSFDANILKKLDVNEIFCFNNQKKRFLPQVKNKSTVLRDQLLGIDFMYDIDCFFQINTQIYETFLEDLGNYFTNQFDVDKSTSPSKIVDLYSGIGTIGITLASRVKCQNLILVEDNKHSVKFAKFNYPHLKHTTVNIIKSDVSKISEKIISDSILIVDPPRVGLTKSVLAKVKQSLPKYIAYLSCDPVTQARDVKNLLENGYRVEYIKTYNFFPRTPHIENLIILNRYSDD